jgi:hypothetical protein
MGGDYLRDRVRLFGIYFTCDAAIRTELYAMGTDCRSHVPIWAADAGGGHQPVVNGLMWKLRTGAQWGDPPVFSYLRRRHIRL